VAGLLAALASHRRRKERERAYSSAGPHGLEVKVEGGSPVPALPRPGTA